MDARVTGYRDIVVKGERKTAYVLTVKYRGEQWDVEKRYSDFSRVHEALRMKFEEVALFSFPRKPPLFSLSNFSTTRQTKERRLDSFGEYIKVLCRIAPQPRELFEFCEAGRRNKISVKPSAREQVPPATGPSVLQNTKLDEVEVQVELGASHELRDTNTSTVPADAHFVSRITNTVQWDTSVGEIDAAAAKGRALSTSIFVSGAAAACVAYLIRLVSGGGPLLRPSLQAGVAALWALMLWGLRATFLFSW